MRFLILIVSLLSMHVYVSALDFKIGHVQRTFVDSSRNNRQVACEIYYPANSNGDNVPIATGVFPTLVFGHGFVMPYSVYDVYWNAIVPKGYIMIFPTTESSFSPSHLNFGKDIAFLTQIMKQQHRLPTSLFFNSIDSTCAVMGHSMGGGSAFLAMQQDPSITGLISIAGAVTNPSSVTAATSISRPSLVISAANDCVAPPKNHQIPMYDSLAANCKTYLSILGGDHCQFASYNFNCSLGQNTCTPKATINAATQQSILFQHILPWINYYLKHQCSAGDEFQTLLSNPNGILSNANCSLRNPNPTIQGENQVCSGVNTQVYKAGNTTGFLCKWTAPKKGSVIGPLNQDSITIRWNTAGIDTIILRLIHPETQCFRDTTYIVTINAAPNPRIVGKGIACSDSIPQTYSITPTQNMVYLWKNVQNGIVHTDLTEPSISISWTKYGMDTLFVRQTNIITNCTKDTQFIVEIHPLPEGHITGEQLVCQSNTNVSYLMQTAPGNTTVWHTPNNGVIIGSKTSNAVSIRWNIWGSDTVKATITDPKTTCTHDTSIVVTIQERPKADIYGTRNICEDNPMSVYKVEPVQGNSYFWTASPTGIIIGPRNLDSIVVRWTKVGKDLISVREKNLTTGCFNDTSFTVTINPKPRPYITGKSIVKEGDKDIIYSVPFYQESMYNWSILSGDAIIRNQDQYQVSVEVGKPGVVLIEAMESNKYDCAYADTLQITVQSAASIVDDPESIDVYPNPMEKGSIITINGSTILGVELYSLLGELATKSFFHHDSTYSIETNTLQSGVYVLRIHSKHGIKTETIIIQ
ncbi:MAG: T9SS type A sorting domain-containing protein [Bacteroidota bacterium]